MNDENESLPSMSVDSEDIKTHPSRHSFDNSSDKFRPLAQPQQESLKQVPRGWFFLMVLALSALTLSTVLLYKNLQVEKIELNKAIQRIAELENKLTSTDTSISQSESVLAVKRKHTDEAIKKNSSEVRKLWAVAYDKNRRAIAVNTDQNEKQKKILLTLQSQEKKQSLALKRVEENIKKIDSLLKETSQRSVFLQESIEELEKSSEGSFASR